MDTNDLQRETLKDFERIYRPTPEPSIRERVKAYDGVENLLVKTKPSNRLRAAVVRRLRYESLLEVAAQAAVIPCEWQWDDKDTVSDLLARQDLRSVSSSGLWLPLLYSARLAGRHRYTIADDENSMWKRFFDFQCLDSSVRDDGDLNKFISLLSLFTLNDDRVIVEPFLTPRTFLEAVLPQPNATTGLTRMIHRWSGQYPTYLQFQQCMTNGLRKFLLFCPDLVALLCDHGWPRQFQTAIWHYYVSWFDQFSPAHGFTRALHLGEKVLQLFEVWERTSENPIPFSEPTARSEIQKYQASLAILVSDNFAAPREWHNAVGFKGPDSDPSNLVMLPPMPARAKLGQPVLQRR